MRKSSIWVRAAKAVLVAGMAIAVAWSSTASAQTTLTPEGTVIKNIATVTYTDANSNTYAAAKDSVMVTVGFLAGIDVIATSHDVNVSAGSTDNHATFWIKNLSNGSTGVDLTLTDSSTVLATNISYIYNSTPYATLDLLEAAIGNIAQGDSVLVTVEYDAASGTGGLTDKLTLGATTLKSTTGGTTASDSDYTYIHATLSGSVAVTPDGTNVGRLPTGSDTAYVAHFTVTNGESGSDTFTLTDSVSTTNTAGLVITKMYLCSDPTKAAITSIPLNAGASAEVCVSYTVADNAAGSTGTIYLTATSPQSSDSGSYIVTIIRPALTISKKAYLETTPGTMSETEVGSTLVLPGQYIWYKMSVTNSGTDAASTVELVDQLPSQVTYVSKTDDAGTPAWTYTGADFGTGLVKAQLTGIATSTTRWIAVRVQIK